MFPNTKMTDDGDDVVVCWQQQQQRRQQRAELSVSERERSRDSQSTVERAQPGGRQASKRKSTSKRASVSTVRNIYHLTFTLKKYIFRPPTRALAEIPMLTHAHTHKHARQAQRSRQRGQAATARQRNTKAMYVCERGMLCLSIGVCESTRAPLCAPMPVSVVCVCVRVAFAEKFNECEWNKK